MVKIIASDLEALIEKLSPEQRAKVEEETQKLEDHTNNAAQGKSDGQEETTEERDSPTETNAEASQADKIVDLAKQTHADFFHTPLNEPFVSFPIDDHEETWPVHSNATRDWLTRLFYRSTNKAPNSEGMRSGLNVLVSMARYDGGEHQVYLRTAWHDGDLYYDLCDDKWRCVKVTKDGWTVVEKSPVRFRRYPHMAPQMDPERG